MIWSLLTLNYGLICKRVCLSVGPPVRPSVRNAFVSANNFFRVYELVYLSIVSTFDICMIPTPGIRESYLAMRARGSNKTRSKVDELVVSRFYLTLVLSDLMSEKSVWDVAAKFALDRGFIQSLLQRCRPSTLWFWILFRIFCVNFPACTPVSILCLLLFYSLFSPYSNKTLLPLNNFAPDFFSRS